MVAGRADNRVPLDEALTHLRGDRRDRRHAGQRGLRGRLCRRAGRRRARNVAAAARRRRRALDRGLHRRPSRPLFDFALAVERIRAARARHRRERLRRLLTGRSEGFIVGRPDLAETIRRLIAYAEAGADCLYAPGIATPSDIVAVVKAVAPKPVNVLVGQRLHDRAELAALGVRRISVGGALARAAWGGFLEAATEIAERGTFSGLGRATAFAEVDGRFEA